MKRLVLLLVLAGPFNLLFFVSAARAQNPPSSTIVFCSDRDGDNEIYLMDTGGGNVQRITYTGTDNHEPDWSPDGSRIVFVSSQGGDYDIMLVNPNGADLVNLTSGSPATDWGPSWQPAVIADSLNGGGTGVIAYCYQPMSGPELKQIYTINLDGTEDRQITDEAIGVNHHEWSPDGEKLAAVGYVNPSTTWSVYVFDADGSNMTRLTHVANVWDNEPSWSPDGTRLAWERIYWTQGHRSEIWVMNVDGSDQQWIGVLGGGVRWSPDGTRLLYHKELANADIWTCNVDGTDEQRLTATPTDEVMPDWSPDGTKIVFNSIRGGDNEIFVMNADGSNERQLTDNSVNDFTPTWSPDGSLIAFVQDMTGTYRFEVFVMDSTGANLRRVTYTPAGYTAINPDWQPSDSLIVPVYLTMFHYYRDQGSVRFVWRVTDDAVTADFSLMARAEGRQRSVPISATGRRSFAAVDDHPDLRAGGEIEYNLYAIGDDGGWDLLCSETVGISAPRTGAALIGVHPNPFNPQTAITFAVNTAQPVRIEIHDTAGRRVATLAEGVYAPGDYRVFWNGRDARGSEVASGVYFLRFQANKSAQTHKLVLVR